MQKIRQFGNGLKNIAKRMESIGGIYQIENNKELLLHCDYRYKMFMVCSLWLLTVINIERFHIWVCGL